MVKSKKFLALSFRLRIAESDARKKNDEKSTVAEVMSFSIFKRGLTKQLLMLDTDQLARYILTQSMAETRER